MNVFLRKQKERDEFKRHTMKKEGLEILTLKGCNEGEKINSK